jgi:hypothetical protein
MTGRSGVVLVIALLLVLLFTTLGLGALAVGMRELHLSAVLDRKARAQWAAESAARRIAHQWSTRRYGAVPVAAETTAPAPETPATEAGVIRVDSALFVIRAAATVSGGRYQDARAAAGLMVATVDPALLAGQFAAPVTADSAIIAVSGTVQGIGTCDGEVTPGTGLRAPRIQLGPGADVQGAPAVDSGPAVSPPISPLLSPARARDLATVRVADNVVSPGPRVVSGVCERAPDNWGSPVSGHVCHDLLPLVWASADLAVDGGQARTTLVVDGDLRMERVEFEGIAVATGRIVIGPDVTLRGAVWGRTVELAGGTLLYDPCALASAATAGGLDRAFAPRGRSWIPMY